MKLAICVATMKDGVFPGDTETLYKNGHSPIDVHHNTPERNLGVVGSYQKLYEQSKEDVLAFIHDDVIMREEGWDERVLKEFEDPEVGVVGFGGAGWHGVPELYKVPYKLQNLRRGDYVSNVDDAEVHGERFTGSRRVAVLDGFSLIVRRTLLDRIGGWSGIARGCDFFCYDYALCALVRRAGFTIRVVGIRCHHRGGNTSVSVRGDITSQGAYDKSHRWFYDEFKDVMPCRV